MKNGNRVLLKVTIETPDNNGSRYYWVSFKWHDYDLGEDVFSGQKGGFQTMQEALDCIKKETEWTPEKIDEEETFYCEECDERHFACAYNAHCNMSDGGDSSKHWNHGQRPRKPKYFEDYEVDRALTLGSRKPE